MSICSNAGLSLGQLIDGAWVKAEKAAARANSDKDRFGAPEGSVDGFVDGKGRFWEGYIVDNDKED